MRPAHLLATVSIVGFALGCADSSPTSPLEAPAAQANLALGPTASATTGLHWTIPSSVFGFAVDNRLTITAHAGSRGRSNQSIQLAVRFLLDGKTVKSRLVKY